MDRHETLEETLAFTDKTFNDTQDLNRQVIEKNNKEQNVSVLNVLTVYDKDPIFEDEESEVVDFARILNDFGSVAARIAEPGFAWTAASSAAVGDFCRRFAFMKSRWMVIFGLLREQGGVCLDRSLCEKLLTTPMVSSDPATGLPVGIEALSAFLRYFRDMNLHSLLKHLPKLESENFWFFDPIFRTQLRHHNVQDPQVYAHLLDEKHQGADAQQLSVRASQGIHWQSSLARESLAGGHATGQAPAKARSRNRPEIDDPLLRLGFAGAEFLRFQSHADFLKAVVAACPKTAPNLYPKFWIKRFLKEALRIFFPLINWDKMAFQQKGCKYVLQIALLLLEYGLFHGSEVPDLLAEMLHCSERLSQAEQELMQTRDKGRAISSSEWHAYGKQSNACRLLMSKICLHLLVLHLDGEVERTFCKFHGASLQVFRDIQTFFSTRSDYENKAFQAHRIADGKVLSQLTRVYTCYLMRDCKVREDFRETVNSRNRLAVEFFIKHFVMFIGHPKEDPFLVSLRSLTSESIRVYRQRTLEARRAPSTPQDPALSVVQRAIEKLDDLLSDLKGNFLVKLEGIDEAGGKELKSMAQKLGQLLKKAMFTFKGATGFFLEDGTLKDGPQEKPEFFDFEKLTRELLEDKKPRVQCDRLRAFLSRDRVRLQVECGMQMLLNKLLLAMNLLTRALHVAEVVVQTGLDKRTPVRVPGTPSLGAQCRDWLVEVRRGFFVALVVARDNSQLLNQFFSVLNKKHLIFLSRHHKKELFFTILLLFEGPNCLTLLRKNSLLAHLLFCFLDFHVNDFGLEVLSLAGLGNDVLSSRALVDSRRRMSAATGETEDGSRWWPLVYLCKLFKRLTQSSKFDRDSLCLGGQKGERYNIFFDQKRGKIDVMTEMKLSNLLSGVLFKVWEAFLKIETFRNLSGDSLHVPLVLRHLTRLLFQSVKNFFDPGFFDRALLFFSAEGPRKAILNFPAMADSRDAQRALFHLLNVYDCFKSAAKTFFSLNTPPPKRGLESQWSTKIRVQFDKCPQLFKLFFTPEGLARISERAGIAAFRVPALFANPVSLTQGLGLSQAEDDLRTEFTMQVAFPVIFKWLQKRKIDRNVFEETEFSLVEQFLGGSYLRLFPPGLRKADSADPINRAEALEFLKIFSSTIQSELDVVFTQEKVDEIFGAYQWADSQTAPVPYISNTVRMMTKSALKISDAQAREENSEIDGAAQDCMAVVTGGPPERLNLQILEQILKQKTLRDLTERVLELTVDRLENEMWRKVWEFEAVETAFSDPKLETKIQFIAFLENNAKETGRYRQWGPEFARLKTAWGDEDKKRIHRNWLSELRDDSKKLRKFFGDLLHARNEKLPKPEQESNEKVAEQAEARVQQELEMMELVFEVSKSFASANRWELRFEALEKVRGRTYEELRRRGAKGEPLGEIKKILERQNETLQTVRKTRGTAQALLRETLQMVVGRPGLVQPGANPSGAGRPATPASAAQRESREKDLGDRAEKLGVEIDKIEEEDGSLSGGYGQAWKSVALQEKNEIQLSLAVQVRFEIFERLKQEPPPDFPEFRAESVRVQSKSRQLNGAQRDSVTREVELALRSHETQMGQLEGERRRLFQEALKEEEAEDVRAESVGAAAPTDPQGLGGSNLVAGKIAPVLRAIGRLQLVQRCAKQEVDTSGDRVALVKLFDRVGWSLQKGGTQGTQRAAELRKAQQQRQTARAVCELAIVKRIDLCLKLVIDFYSMSPRHLRFLTVNRILDQNDMAVCDRILTRERQSLASQLEAKSGGGPLKIYEDPEAKFYVKKNALRDDIEMEVRRVDRQGRPAGTLSAHDRWSNGKLLRMTYLFEYKDYKTWICETGGDGQVFDEIMTFKGQITGSSRHLIEYMFRLMATMRPDTPRPGNIFTHFESFYCLNKPFYAVLMLLGRLMDLPEEHGDVTVRQFIHKCIASEERAKPEAKVFLFDLWRLFCVFQAFLRRKNFQVKDYFAIYRPFFTISNFFKNLCENNFGGFKVFFNEKSERDLLEGLPPDLRERFWRNYEASEVPLAQTVYTDLVSSIGRSDLANVVKREVDIFDRPSHFYVVHDLVYMLTEFVNGGVYRPEWVLETRFQTSVWADILHRIVDDPNDYFYVIKHKVLMFLTGLVESEHQSLLDFLKAQISCDMLVETILRMVAKLYIYCRKKQRTRRPATEQELIFAETSQSKKSVALNEDDLRDEASLIGRLTTDHGDQAAASAAGEFRGEPRRDGATRPPLSLTPRIFLGELLEFYYTCDEDFAEHQLIKTAVLMMNLLSFLGERLPEFAQKIQTYDSMVPSSLKLQMSMNRHMKVEYVFLRVKSWLAPPGPTSKSRDTITDNEIVIWFFLTQIIDQAEIVEVKNEEPAEEEGGEPPGPNKGSGESEPESRIVVQRFRKLPEMFFYSYSRKLEFIQQTNIESRESKLDSFYDDFDDKYILLQNVRSRYKASFVFFALCRLEFFEFAIFVLFLLAVAINVLMLLFYNRKSNDFNSFSRQDQTTTVMGLTAASLAVSGTFLVLWFVKATAFVKLKMLQESKNSRSTSTFKFYVILVAKVVYKLPWSSEGLPFFLVSVFYILGLFKFYLWLTLPLFLISFISTLLGSIIKAIMSKIDKLISVLAVIFAFASVFAMWAMQVYQAHFETGSLYSDEGSLCSSFSQCVVNLFLQGMRLSSGIANQMVLPSQPDQRNYASLYVFMLLSFTIIVLFLLGAFFGLVVDTFKNYREALTLHEIADNSVCFICGINKSEFDRYNLNFRAHTDHEHNIFSYFGLCLFLNSRKKVDFSGREMYIHSMMNSSGRNDVVPCLQCRTFQLRGLKVEKEGED